MAERDRFRERFVNPYVDKESEEARLNALVTMDEVQERWRRGSWKPDEEDFRLSPSFFNDAAEEEDEPSYEQAPDDTPEANRFAFNLQKDILHADQPFSDTDDVAYTDSYRPRGDIGSGISNLALDRMRYNALAGIEETLPDDLSYLGGETTDSKAVKRVRKPSVRDRRYVRLETPVEKRRAKVEQMIPHRQGETVETIIEEVKKGRAAREADSGTPAAPTVRRRSGLYHMYEALGISDEEPPDAYDVERVTGRGSWRSEIPHQDGLVPDTRAMPYFGRFSRTWSKIDTQSPTRADLLRHTVNTIYDYADDGQSEEGESRKFRSNSRERRGYAVDDADFDPENRYRRLPRKRRRIAADKNVLTERILSGDFHNPYAEVDGERLKSLIDHDMRGPGQSPAPEGLTDPALIHEWNTGYSRINNDENRYAAWFNEQSRLAEHAEQSRYRGSHRTGRPGAYLQRERPYGEGRRYPGGEYTEHESRRRDVQEQVERAARRGMEDGEKMIRRRQEAERQALEAQRRAMEEQRKQQEAQRLEQQRAAYQKQQALYQQQREQMIRQQQEYFKQQQEYMKRQQEYLRQQQNGEAASRSQGTGQYPPGYPAPQGTGQYPPGYPMPQGTGQYPPGYPMPQGTGQYPQGYPTPQGAGQYPQGYPMPQGNGQSPQGYPAPQGAGQYPQGYPMPQGTGQSPQGYPAPQGAGGQNGGRR